MMRLFLSLAIWMTALLHIETSQIDLKCGLCERGARTLTCQSSLKFQYELKFAPIHGRPNKQLLFFNCQSHDDHLDLSLLDGCSFPFVESVKFYHCRLNQNETFVDLLTKIGVSPSQLLDLIYTPNFSASSPRYLTFERLLFEGLSNLTSIQIVDANFASISPDAFIQTPKLKSLVLSGNYFGNLPAKVFSPLNRLEHLTLSNNELNDISADAFRTLSRLEYLSLRSNKIETLYSNHFSNLTELSEVILPNNHLKSIPESIFSSCSNLSLVDLSSNYLESVPSNLFNKNLHLEKLLLSDNHLSFIPLDFLVNLESLIELDLSVNRLTNLPGALLSSNKKLSIIDLQSNLLENLPRDVFIENQRLQIARLNSNNLTKMPYFAECQNLAELYLQKNNLSSLSLSHFPLPKFPISNSTLKILDLSFNNLDEHNTETYGSLAFANQINLEEINLSNNQFRSLPQGFYSYINLKTLNLSENSINLILFHQFSGLANNAVVDLKSNRLKRVIGAPEPQINIDINLSDNELSCDCGLYPLARYLQKTKVNEQNVRVIEKYELKCNSPKNLMNKTILEVDLSEFICKRPSHPQCSVFCPCSFRPFDGVAIVECSSKLLTAVPKFDPKSYISWKYTYDLSNNDISYIDFSDKSLEKVINITLRGNIISSESLNNVTMLPVNLTFLDMRDNKLQTLSENFTLMLNASKIIVRLDGNPWKCDCYLKHLLKYLQTSYAKVVDIERIQCAYSKRPLMDLKISDLCPFYIEPAFIAGATVAALIVVASAVLVTILFYRYKNAIFVWLYAHKMCLWLITREEIDGDKKYDAFISYSHKDEAFVMDTLVHKLENESPKYRLCIHHRDWIPGELIYDQILNSVNDSRRTIVILSVDFIKSEWGQAEFKHAHQQTLKDKTNRVIVIVYGELPSEDSMDQELVQYIKLHTYLKWDNPKFWDQLRYAMPHSRDLNSKRKNLNYSLDKIELVNGHSRQSLQV